MGIIDWLKVSSLKKAETIIPSANIRVVAHLKENKTNLKTVKYEELDSYLWILDNDKSVLHIIVSIERTPNKTILEFVRENRRPDGAVGKSLTNFKDFGDKRRELLAEMLACNLQFMLSMKDKYESSK